ncbi:hypothetical protein [Streptomyces atroolivaceus]|uniref:hypothetical protein n=1 Tax=Streptomyces atroolivaceus TaxID=66869 RepID=UPI0037A609B3
MHRVVALVRPVQSTFELACAVEVFGTERARVPQHYEFEVCTETPGRVQTTAGYAIYVSQGLAALDSADTVIIPGWLPVEEPLSDGVCRALPAAHTRGGRSTCAAASATRWARHRAPTGRRSGSRDPPDRLG